MSWIFDLLEGRSPYRTGPLTNKEINLLKKEISRYIMKAERAFNNGFYSDARKNYIKALSLENINPESLPDSIDNLKTKIEYIENIVNKEIINKSILTLEKGDYLRSEAKFQEAFDEYQKAFSLINTMAISDSDLRAERINEIYLKQINCLIEEGNVFGSTNLNERSAETFSKALEVAGRMISSVEKTDIMKRLNKILDKYSERINGIIESGISLTKKNKFEEARQLFQEAQNIIKEKYSKLPNTMTNRFKETSDLREVDKLIEQSINKISIDVNTISLLGVPSDQESYDVEEKKEIHIPEKAKSDQPSHYTCEYCGIELNEKPRFCPKCGIIFKESST